MIDTHTYERREGEQDPEYPLALKHVKQFLATKEEHDSLGYCYFAIDCLLSETLNWLYPMHSPWRVDLCTYFSAHQGQNNHRLDPECYFLRAAFDRCGGLGGKLEVTKAQLRAYLESVVLDQGDKIGGMEIPFDIDDLFGE